MNTISAIFADDRPGLDVGPRVRTFVALAAATLSVAAFYALARGITGIAPPHSNARSLAVVIHVATVLPAVTLGAWLLLARKGGASHKLLGKLWIMLMLTTATAAFFIRRDNEFSWIHIFVPLTFIGSWQVFSTARRGQIAAHRQSVLQMFFGALMIPGLFAFTGDRLLAIWLLS